MSTTAKQVGILALQGDFDAHHRKLVELGATPLFVKHEYQLAAVSALVIPGGESTTMLRLLNAPFKSALISAITSGMPVLATCAGCILLAKDVTNPKQQSLSLIDIDIVRNAYGRQVDSFIERGLSWTSSGQDLLREMLPQQVPLTAEGVFIRAPQISRTGRQVQVLVDHHGKPVLVKEGNILACTFHPELSEQKSTIHDLLLKLA